jgi:aspartyl protease family protein
MPGALGLGLILLAMAGLALSQGERPVAGLEPREIAALASFAAVALLVAGAVVNEFRGRWADGFRSLAVWAVIIIGLVAAYGYRDEVREVGARIVGELAPESPVVSAGGEVQITRRLDGSFLVGAKIGDKDVRLIFDTGASTVVLTAESAATLGIRPRPAEFIIPVMTANGASLTAPIVLDRLSIGNITERRVRALVARPGALHQNLLGMTFLDRLASYEVRSNRLILRPKTS